MLSSKRWRFVVFCRHKESNQRTKSPLSDGGKAAKGKKTTGKRSFARSSPVSAMAQVRSHPPMANVKSIKRDRLPSQNGHAFLTVSAAGRLRQKTRGTHRPPVRFRFGSGQAATKAESPDPSSIVTVSAAGRLRQTGARRASIHGSVPCRQRAGCHKSGIARPFFNRYRVRSGQAATKRNEKARQSRV